MGVSAATAATKSTSRTSGKQAGPGRADKWRFARQPMKCARLINFCQLWRSFRTFVLKRFYLNTPMNTSPIAAALDGDEFRVVGVSPTINLCYNPPCSLKLKFWRFRQEVCRVKV